MDMRSLAQRALTESALPDEAITVNQRALIDKILARYSAEFTVFRELLQNADDAGASECELRLVSEPRPIPHVPDTQALLTQWTFRNNGAPFSDDDWHRLRRIAEGNPDPERIGAFGVGFYSLFSVCDEPIVSSGDQLMGFFWKGDALFTRRAHAPAQAASSTGVPWTTFLMALREPTPFPESPLALCQFLATSLTFTSHVRSVGLYLDDQLLCHLDKHVGAPEPLVPSRHLRATSPEKIMAVQELHTSPLQVHVRVARCILLEAAEAAALAQTDELRRALLSAVSHDLRTPLAAAKAAAEADPHVDPEADLGAMTWGRVTVLDEPAEQQLALLLSRFGEIVDVVAADLTPHKLCTYLYELAGAYSSFYEKCPVLRSEGQVRSSRLALCEAVRRVLKTGLGLLGIDNQGKVSCWLFCDSRFWPIADVPALLSCASHAHRCGTVLLLTVGRRPPSRHHSPAGITHPSGTGAGRGGNARAVNNQVRWFHRDSPPCHALLGPVTPSAVLARGFGSRPAAGP